MDILEVLKVLNNNGFESYFVGGYPRDKYMNKETVDYDIATIATPKELKLVFGSNVSSDNYGCVNLIYKNKKYEVTTFRKDIKYNDVRNPVIEYVDDIKVDLMRRDFIMNTILIDKDGKFIDYLDGMNDIDNKIIRVVGNTNKKIKEDPLRILRAIRFATTLNFTLSKDLEEAILKYGSLVKNLSYERRKGELDKIFVSPNIEYGIELIKKFNLEIPLEINLYDLKTTKYLVGIWAQINNLNYPFNKAEKETIKLVNELKNKDVLDNYNLYRYGLYISTIAGEINGIDSKVITEKYNKLSIKSRNEIDITVKEICEVLNKEPDSFLQMVLEDLEHCLLDEKFENDKNVIVKYLCETYL